MVRFVKKGLRVRRVRKAQKPTAGRRRLVKTYKPFQPVRNVVRLGGAVARRAKVWATGRKPVTARGAQKNFNSRLSSSDNITNAPTFKIGSPRKISFQEKIDRVTNPPVVFKRQYAWSAECSSGRKGFFGIPINKLSSGGILYGDLYDDAITSVSRITTDSSVVDPTINYGGQVKVNKVYVDYLSEKLQMVNSGSNSLKGKLTLYSYKRDCDSTFTNVNVPMTPINLMMLSSTNNLSQVTPLGYDQTVGNGFEFDTVTAGVNMTANYDMPGSTINSGGATAQTDLSLKVMSRHIKEFTGYYFNEVKSVDFSLKPGQQMNHYTIFNDLPNIQRNNTDMYYIKGVSYYIVIEFQAGIVGDSTVSAGDNVISTGSGQLSCILEEKRIIGMRGRDKGGKVYMATPPLAGIAKASQYIINPDTGVADTGYDEDA